MKNGNPDWDHRFSGGGGWIRTTEANATDLQSAPFGHSGTPPNMNLWSWWTDSNPRPADYKSAALPAELHQRIKSAVQQQVLFYQKVYTLSTAFFIFSKKFCAPMSGPPEPWRQRVRLPVTTQRRWCVTRIRGFPGLLPALRDLQLAAPVSLCPLCGEEQYRGDQMLRRNGRLICVRCADRLSRAERREEKEDGEP